MSEEAGSGKAWSKVAQSYAKMVNENDLAGPAGTAGTEILAVVDEKLPFDKASYIFDVGVGGGAVISRVFDSEQHVAQIPDEARIVAADVSQNFVDIVSQRKNDRSGTKPIWERLEVHRWDATDLKEHVQDDEVSHILSSYVYFAMRGEDKGLAEALRILKPGGLFIATSMGYTDWGHLPTFIKEVRPDKEVPQLGKHWQSAAGVRKLLSDVGFVNTDAREYDMGIAFETVDDAVEFVMDVFPFVKPLMADMSETDSQKTKELMSQYLRERYSQNPVVLKGTGVIGWGMK